MVGDVVKTINEQADKAADAGRAATRRVAKRGPARKKAVAKKVGAARASVRKKAVARKATTARVPARKKAVAKKAVARP
jgi:hypothetical protein